MTKPIYTVADSLKLLRGFARTARYCRERGWPTGDGMKIDSGDDSGPQWSEEFIASLEQAWTLLTPEEQMLLAPWRKQHLDCK